MTESTAAEHCCHHSETRCHCLRFFYGHHEIADTVAAIYQVPVHLLIEPRDIKE